MTEPAEAPGVVAMRVLYLEDNVADANLTIRSLGKSQPPIEAEIVRTVAEALARLDDLEAALERGEPAPFDLALLDMHLPDGSGLGVVTQIRRRSLPLAAVVLTGFGDEESVLSALRSGADDYLPKRPEFWTRLPAVLLSALDGFQAKAALRQKPIRLLCAEPNATDVALMDRHLSSHAPFIHVERVRTGSEVLARLPDSGPVADFDVLLLDYRLPDMNALEILKEIIQVRRLDVPPIVYTGLGSEDIALEALKLGAFDYVVKSPGYLDRLPLAVEKAFYRASAGREHKALRESEARLRTIFETEPECILVVGATGGILEANPAGLALLQAGSTAALRDRTLESFVLPEFAGPFRGLFGEVMSGRGGTLEFRVRGLRGAERWVDAHAAPMGGDEGRTTFFLGIFRDITERKAAEERAQQTQKMNAFGQLAGGVAHDFNNQLGAILGYAEMLAARITEPDLLRFANSIVKAAQRSSELTRNLLTFARQAPHQSIPLDLHLIIGETMDLLERTIDKRIIVSSRLAAGSATILGDPSQIQNALLNLALNARDAMPEGGVLNFGTEAVHVGPAPEGPAERDSVFLDDPGLQLPEGRYIDLTISDTGTGMSDEVKRRIFEPFFTTKPVGRGTGMGLASVFGTAKLHRGAITLTSALGHGTVFHLYLPVSERELDGSLRVALARPKVGRIGVLVVDDEPMLRELLADLLIQEGHTVYTASNGKEALKVYRDAWSKIDLVILDMIMPEMGGRETFRSLREIRPEVRVLVSSGYTPNEEVQSILDEGIQGVLHKPYTRALLEEAILKVVTSST